MASLATAPAGAALALPVAPGPEAKASPAKSGTETGAPDRIAAIQAAREAVEEQRYEDAVALATPLFESGEPRIRVSALETAAVAHLLAGHEAAGRSLVARLYELAPAHELVDRSLPPRVTTAFDAEAARPHARSVALQVGALSADTADYELMAKGPSANVEVACTVGKDSSFARVSVSLQTNGSRKFKLPTLGAYRCFLVALDRDDIPLGRLGTRTSPVTLRAKEKPEGGLLSKWWFWTGVGVAVTGAGATAFLLTRSDPAPAPPADLTLRPH